MSRTRRQWTIFFTSICLASGLSPLPAQVPAVQITAFHPPEASYLGKTPFEIRGQGFTVSTRVRIDGAAVGVNFVDATRLTGMIPVHDPTGGPVPVTVDGGSGGDVLLEAVTFVGPYEVSRVRPGLLPAGTGGQIVISGTAFTPESAVAIGGSTVDQASVRFIDTRTLEVQAPGKAPGRYNVRVFEPSTLVPGPSFTLEGGLGYVRDLMPGPQQVETSLAEGTARFSWYNPVAYDEIEVIDSTGAVIRRLDGSETSIELPTGSADRIDLGLRGVLNTGELSELTDAIAKLLFCAPQPLAGNAEPGEIDLSLRGGHAPAGVVRCGPDPTGPDGAGAHAGHGIGIEDLGSMGFPVPTGSTGRMLPAWLLDDFPDPNSLVTGFLLEEDATVLDISGFYQKLAVFPGLELRGRIVQVASPTNPELENGFTDEFTFPGTTLAGKKEWHSVTYFRADKDVGYIPDPNDDNDESAQPCLDEQQEIRKIPAGEYLLELYAVGGSAGEQYFTFADDSRDYELLIRNAPCPPYPLVKVTNMTGRYTLPVLTKIEATVNSVQDGKPVVRVQVAEGTWLDENAMLQHVGPGYSDNPDFEYVWTVYDRGGNPLETSSGSASNITTKFQDWGCYYIDITVKDKACPRSRTQSFQVAVAPDEVDCTPGNDYFSFLFPTPEPSGICGIVGLDPPPGGGQMANQRPIEFRVLVAPKYFCSGLSGPAVFIGDVEFTLAVANFVFVPGQGLRIVYDPVPGVELEVTDLCPDVTDGLKYLHVKILDLGALPNIPGAEDGTFRSVYFAGRTNFFYQPDGTRFEVVDPSDKWHRIGPAMRLTNRPPALEQSFWTGIYDEKADTYYFSMQAATSSRVNFPIGVSEETPLPIEGAPQEISIPSYGNDVTTGFNPIFKMHQEKFDAVDGIGGTAGECFGNKIEGAAQVIKPVVSQGAALGGPGGSFPKYEWNECRTIFSNELSQTLFESILYTGTIGPVPVTVWASIGLGIDFLMQARTTVELNPFAAIEGGHFLKSDAALYSSVGVSIPCEIRADVLFGVASIAARLIPEAEVQLGAHVGVVDTTPALGAFMGAYLSLFFEIEACIWALVDEICYSPGRVAILEDEELLRFDFGDGAPGVSECEETALPLLPPEGAGAGILDPTFKLATTSRPGVGVAPSGGTTLYAVAVEVPEGSFGDARMLGVSFIEGQQVFNTANAVHDGIDPAVSFLSNSTAMIAWTRGGIPGAIPVFDEIDRRNFIAAHQDVLLTVHRAATGWVPGGESNYVLVSDRPEEVPASQKSADGMASMSADLSAAAQQAGGQALVAWVRYEGPFLVEDAQKTRIYEQDPLSQKPYLKARDVDTIRPNLEHTAIHARRMGPSGPLSPAVRISPAGPGINVEPTLSVSPSGATAYCVWVRATENPDTGLQQVNLTDSNLGRNLAVAVYTKAGESWTPAQVIPVVLPDDFPGMLEPSIALKGDHDGLLAFTALRPGSSETDSGLANSRYVFTSRLVSGVFQEPVLVHGKCLLPEVGHWPQVAWAAPLQGIEVPGGGTVNVASADFVLTYLGTGAAGTRSGSGNVMVAALGGDSWTAPRSLTLDDDVHSNIVTAVSPTGSLKTIHFNGGPAQVPSGLGRGAGLGSAPRTLDAESTLLLPDAAISACRVSDAFAAPGSRVTAAVEIGNLGLAATPTDSGGTSLLAVQAVLVDDLGRERKAVLETVPVLAPGESVTVELALEVPHDPVLLRVLLGPNPLDMDPSNNSRESFLGAPTPKGLGCAVDFQIKGHAEDGSEIERAVARLSWSNPALYEALRVYRDGSMLAEIAGDATDFVDSYADIGNHVYEVRGMLGVSKSRRARCEVELPPPPPSGGFRRGDADSSGDLSITDGIVVLGYLFLGSEEPPCLDAADADDDGNIVITDAIAILGYLFLGSSAPPAPGPDVCGADPTPDAMPPCGGACP